MLKHWPPPPRITFPLIGSVLDIITRQHDRTGWHITEDWCPSSVLLTPRRTPQWRRRHASRLPADHLSPHVPAPKRTHAPTSFRVNPHMSPLLSLFPACGFRHVHPSLPRFSSMRPSENGRALEISGAFQVPHMGKRHSEPCLLATAILSSVWFSLLGLSGMYNG